MPRRDGNTSARRRGTRRQRQVNQVRDQLRERTAQSKGSRIKDIGSGGR